MVHDLSNLDMDDGQQGLDLSGIVKFLQMLSREMNLINLVEKMMEIVIENAEAERGFLLQYENDELIIQAKGSLKSGIRVLQSKRVAGNNRLSSFVVQKVIDTGKVVVIADAASTDWLQSDDYIQQKKTKSILCHPVYVKGKLTAIIYLENNAKTDAFSSDKLKLINLLSTQITISLENALLYQNLEEKVIQRTEEVVRQKEIVESAYSELRATQSQLVHSEKMASLGQLTAGIAHEINNPINFISIGIAGLKKNFASFLKVVEKYESIKVGENNDQILEDIKSLKTEIQYEEVKQFILGLMDDIRLGADRTSEIIVGLRSFSRLNEAEQKDANVHEGLDATLVLLRSKTKNNIEIIKEYDDTLPNINCNPGQLNQVFMNIITNAIEAIEMQENGGESQIKISTKNKESTIEIKIKDSGIGVTEETRANIFEPFFTTKDVGKGTGLGLSISFGIIEKHRGKIELKNAKEGGAEFIITLPKQAM
ncbi:MAG: ATP-binding protein [Bacteroidota bacterium]